MRSDIHPTPTFSKQENKETGPGPLWSQASLCDICDIRGGHSGTETGFSPSTSVFPCQYHSTDAAHSFVHLHTRCTISTTDTVVK
jgi:hypothetical protein